MKNHALLLPGDMPTVSGSGGSYTYTYDPTGRVMFLDGGASIVSAVTRDEPNCAG